MNQQLSCNIKYSALHGCYQLSMVLMMGYASVYMIYLGFADAMIGIVLAIANLLAAILQPAFGNFLDKRKHISVQLFAVGILAISMVLSLILLLTQKNHWSAAVCFILIFSLIASIQPMLNSICFILEQMGIHINFGLSRGIGSVCYAAFSASLGVILLHISTLLLPVIYIIIFATLACVLFSLRKTRPEDSAQTSETFRDQALPLGQFIRTYRRFILLLLGCFLIFIFLYASGNYFTIYIVSDIGGGTKEMGFATAIAALVELPAMAFCNKLGKKVPYYWILRISGIFFLVKFFILMVAPNIPVFYIGQLFQFLSFALFFPAIVSYTEEILPAADLVKGQALITTMMSASGILSSLSGGILLGYTSVAFMLHLMFAIAVVGVVILWMGVQKKA